MITAREIRRQDASAVFRTSEAISRSQPEMALWNILDPVSIGSSGLSMAAKGVAGSGSEERCEYMPNG